MSDKIAGRDGYDGRYPPIQDHGLIGNLHTIALVSIRGTINFMPFTRIDSPTIFTSLLDADKGGSFSIDCLHDNVTHKQMYLPDTAILMTRFLAADGVAELIDFMPVKKTEERCSLIRRLRIVRGQLTFRISCSPSFGYARHGCEIEKETSAGAYLFKDPTGEQNNIRLFCDLDMEVAKKGTETTITLKEQETVDLIMEVADHQQDHLDPESKMQSTISYWKEWSSKSNYQGRWKEEVNRSAMTLKLLTNYQFGSVVAAGTFGLPESPGGTRNWDYRFTWLRDAAFTMYAFLRLGYMNEAEGFMNWIRKRLEDTELQIMYGIDGTKELEEVELDHLEGYRGAKPVRIGNGAYQQTQMDIYGEFIDTIYLYNKHGGSISYQFWKKVEKQVNFLCENWKKKDHGIWEVRSQKQEFLHSRVMCWVALDRALRIAEDRSFPSETSRWKKVRDEIYRDIYENFWDEEKGAYVQYKGAKVLDASALLLPLVRYMSSSEPRWVSTFEQIKKELVTEPLVYRYKVEGEETDGLEGDEGTFSICSFWYVECLARMGNLDESILSFEKMLGYANHLGLFSEQLGLDGSQLGNFPQAFTHLSLISAAYQIDKQHHKLKD
ncbi:glycoside hydrolase family 15 protein [Roseivirga sp. BDSF3-8]|uniref:glycoside hydrolase family 15 protein n=1 Tax=Roseivirga sp. BDSF3-8 TaxID=3241598 RepID=UPI003531FE69